MATSTVVSERLVLQYGVDGDGGSFSFGHYDSWVATEEKLYNLGLILNSLQDDEHRPAEFLVVTRNEII